jgi:serine/threonine protein kinase HipA of HipAB toxin-antitoxin module
MPTTRPRHTITETPSVQAALDQLRSRLAKSERIDFAELVMLGAEAKARQIAADDDAAAKARKDLAEMIRTGSFRYSVDVEAADEVKHLGLIARYDE